MVSKVFEKLVNKRFVDHLNKLGLFSDFHFCFRSYQSFADLQTILSDRIGRAFNTSEQGFLATRVVALDRFWHAGLRHKLKSYEISGQIFALNLLVFFSIDGSGWLWTGGFSKNIKLRLEFLKSSFLVLHLFYYTLINNLPDDAIHNIAIYVDDITLYSKCDQSSDDDN